MVLDSFLAVLFFVDEVRQFLVECQRPVGGKDNANRAQDKTNPLVFMPEVQLRGSRKLVGDLINFARDATPLLFSMRRP